MTSNFIEDRLRERIYNHDEEIFYRDFRILDKDRNEKDEKLSSDVINGSFITNFIEIERMFREIDTLNQRRINILCLIYKDHKELHEDYMQYK